MERKRNQQSIYRTGPPKVEVQFIVGADGIHGSYNEYPLTGKIIGHHLRLKAITPGIKSNSISRFEGSLENGDLKMRLRKAHDPPGLCAVIKLERIGDAPKRITEKDPDQTLETNSGETVSTPTDAEAPTIHLPDTLVSASHEIELVGKVTDQQITAGELHAYISDNVSRQALRLGRVQTPQLQGNEERVLISW